MKIMAGRTNFPMTLRIPSGLLSLLAAIAFAGMSATSNATTAVVKTGAPPAKLPRVSISTADRLGLRSWRDLDSGKEVRRAQAISRHRAGLVIRNDSGKRINYSLKWGQGGKSKSYIVERRTNRWHAFPAETAPIPYLRLENADGEAGRM